MESDREHVTKLVQEFTRFNVFSRHSSDLVSITKGDVASDNVKNDLLKAEETGKKVIYDFVNDRLINKSTKFHDRIKRKNLNTFETLYSGYVSVDKKKTVSIKADRDLFRQVIVALKGGREVDVDRLLEHELSSVPVSLATFDEKLRFPATKAALSKILEQGMAQNHAPVNNNPTCTILDGMAIVQSLGNRFGANTFGEWCDNFQKSVNTHFSETCTRVDIVFDQYLDNSIKGGTRSKRLDGKGKGIRTNVDNRDQKIGKWERFITLGQNKASLANFLCIQLASSHCDVPIEN
jgi:hypothetical protein